jgi:hypothetical protein
MAPGSRCPPSTPAADDLGLCETPAAPRLLRHGLAEAAPYASETRARRPERAPDGRPLEVARSVARGGSGSNVLECARIRRGAAGQKGRERERGSAAEWARDALGILFTSMRPPVDITVSAPSPAELPREFQTRALGRRTLGALTALAVLVAIFLLAPGLDEVRDRLAGASPGWLALATLLEGLSFASYVVMFGPIFCTGLSWRRSWHIGGSELAMGSLVPASGAGGLALGAWVLHRGGWRLGGSRGARWPSS